jgi:hypothetical protein
MARLASNDPRSLTIRRSLTALIAVLALAVCAVPALAAGGTVNVPKKLSPQIAKAHAKNNIPVLLPSRMKSALAPKRVFGHGKAGAKGYRFELGYGRSCNGANVCFLAAFIAKQGATPTYKTKVSLAKGITGYYKPFACGASCGPSNIQWVQDGVLYTIQSKSTKANKEKQSMVAYANSAIRKGAR